MGVVLNLNRIELVGRLTHNPECVVSNAETPGTAPFKRCKFSIAVTRDRFKPDQPPETDFFYITAWGMNAEVIAKYFRKGDPIMVFGEMHMSRYTDKNGVDREGWGVALKDFKFVKNPKKRKPQTGEPEEPS